MIDWNAYRAAYRSMTYSEVAHFHEDVWVKFPDQRHHSERHLAEFFAEVATPASVVEVGGWRGEAAARTLAAHPGIVRWDNFEICEPAAHSPVTTDLRYRGIFPDRWPWETEPGRYDAAVLAHVIEHMVSDQLTALIGWLDRCGVRRMYVEAPLEDRARGWRNSTSAHILEVGWPEVIAILAGAHYRVLRRVVLTPRLQVLMVGR